MRVLGIDRNSENIKRARAFKRFVEREEGEYFSDDSEPETGESDTDSEWTFPICNFRFIGVGWRVDALYYKKVKPHLIFNSQHNT